VKLSAKLIPEDNSKQYLVSLTEKVLLKSCIEMDDKIEMSFPTIKFNPATVAKIAEMDKQACEVVFDSIIEELKKIINENVKDLVLDIGFLGTIKVKDRKATHHPCEKMKSSNVFGHKKTTIKSLFQKEQMPKKLPTLNEPIKLLPADTIPNESLGKTSGVKPKPGQDMEKSALNHSIIDKLSNTFRISDEEQSGENLESPTRRYKKHPIVLKKEMLGAGLDPLNKEQDFSVLAKTGKNLMTAHFVKPGSTATRFPPIINAFSRTLASPICSSPVPLPLPHRIGSNLSLKCVGLYIHP
jgi:dynein heavy chain